MKKFNLPLFTFCVLAISLIAVIYLGDGKKVLDLPGRALLPVKKMVPTPTASPPPSSGQAASASYPDWPVPPDSSDVTITYIHYFFTGKIAEIEKTGAGGQIRLDTANEKIPPIDVSGQTRIFRISLPYTNANMRPITFDTLQVGTVVDVSAEYDIKAKSWIIRDVYVQDDRN